MSEQSKSTNIHLPSLSIKHFRGIPELSIPKLGQVTLIAGRNGAGKTTILEAIKVYASRGKYSVLSNILESREEFTEFIDETGEMMSVPDIRALAYGRCPTKETCVSIGMASGEKRLDLRFGPGSWGQMDPLTDEFLDPDEPVLTVEFDEVLESIFAFHLARPSLSGRVIKRSKGENLEAKILDPIRCISAGPGLMDNKSMAQIWDRIALTGYESRAIRALQLIYGDDVERIAMVGEEGRRIRKYDRRALVKMKGREQPVPLKSLGDGALRLFGIALSLANSKGGFFVIDEAENGIHHQVQAVFWKMVMQAAHENKVQVLATTHSWDCVVGFSQAAAELDNLDGLLLRIERLGDGARVVEYTQEDLQIAAHQGIEVR